MNNLRETYKRLELLSWLLIPALAVWLSTNYLVGSMGNKFERPPGIQEPNTNVLGKSITPPENNIEKLSWNKKGLVTLWFDDAWASQYSIAFPALEERGFKAALAVPTNLVGYEAYMDWFLIQKLQYKGWEITSHTRGHTCELDKSNLQALEYEIAGGRDDLLSKGLRAEIFVSPCGVNSTEMDEVVKKSHLAQRLTEPGINPLPLSDPYHLKVRTIQKITTARDVADWLNEARGQRGWLILAFHQIGLGGEEYSTAPETLREILDLIENSGLTVVLPSQVVSLR